MRTRAIANSLCSPASHSFKNTSDRMEVSLSSTLGQYISFAFFCCSLTLDEQCERSTYFRRRLDLVLRRLPHRRVRSTGQDSSRLGFQLDLDFVRRKQRRRRWWRRSRDDFQRYRDYEIRTGQSSSFLLRERRLIRWSRRTFSSSDRFPLSETGTSPRPSRSALINIPPPTTSGELNRPSIFPLRLDSNTRCDFFPFVLDLVLIHSLCSSFDERRTVRSPGSERTTASSPLPPTELSLSTIASDRFFFLSLRLSSAQFSSWIVV